MYISVLLLSIAALYVLLNGTQKHPVPPAVQRPANLGGEFANTGEAHDEMHARYIDSTSSKEVAVAHKEVHELENAEEHVLVQHVHEEALPKHQESEHISVARHNKFSYAYSTPPSDGGR